MLHIGGGRNPSRKICQPGLPRLVNDFSKYTRLPRRPAQSVLHPFRFREPEEFCIHHLICAE
jgi:hypothetical protein